MVLQPSRTPVLWSSPCARLVAQENNRGIRVESRWIECRDTDGTQLWTYELDPTWFPLKTAHNEHIGALWCEMYEWLPNISEEWHFQQDYVTSYGSGAMSELLFKSELRAAYPPAVIRLNGQSLAMISAGSHLLGLQTDTGKVIWIRSISVSSRSDRLSGPILTMTDRLMSCS